MKRIGFFCVAWLLFVSPAVAQNNRETADAAFKAGIEAFDDKKWQEAAGHLRRATQLDPREDTRRVSHGNIFERKRTEYLPYYFLGQALFNLQDCASAVDAWSTSEAQGTVKVRPESGKLMGQGYTACEAKGVLPPAKYNPLLARTRQQLNDLNGQLAAVSDRGKSHLDVWRSDPNLQAQYDRASTEYQAAQTRFTAATRSRSDRDFADAAAAGERVRTVLVTLRTQLETKIAAVIGAQEQAKQIDQLLGEGRNLESAIDAKKPFITPALAALRQAASESMSRARSQLAAGREGANEQVLNDAHKAALDGTNRLQQVMAEIGKVEERLFGERLAAAVANTNEAFSLAQSAFALLELRFTEKPSEVTDEKRTQREALQKQFAALERRRDGAIRNKNINGIEQAAQLAGDVRTQVVDLVAGFGPVTIIDRGVKPELAEGARLFFEGEYERALTVLDLENLNDVLFQAHVHLFRAASHYALFMRSGERDQSRKTQAVAEVEKCKQRAPTLQPDPRAFAPRFISFYTSPDS